jgi:hypothetical protein
MLPSGIGDRLVDGPGFDLCLDLRRRGSDAANAASQTKGVFLVCVSG